MSETPSLAGLDWIAVDWGTSSLRVWAMDAQGGVLDRATSREGMSTLWPQAYEAVLVRIVSRWLGERTEPVPVIVCGMAGARQGWHEAAYRQAPCRPATSGSLTAVETAETRLAVSIVPGICQDDPPDVMRGEETQLAGLLAGRNIDDGVVCMPGTHSKWVRLAGGRVSAFTTVMTGEIFALLAERSVLRHTVDGGGHDAVSFAQAVTDMLAAPETLTAALFSVRAGALLDDAGPDACRSRLSGLLVGAEIAAMRQHWAGKTVHVVGAGPLVERYAEALRVAGADAVPEDGDALTLAGLSAVRAGINGGKT